MANKNETSSLDKGSSQELENARPSVDISMQPGLPAHLNTPAYRRGMRKVDIYVTGVVLLLYLFAFLDKANLGNARIEGLQKVSTILLATELHGSVIDEAPDDACLVLGFAFSMLRFGLSPSPLG